MTERLLLAGVSHRSAPIAVRERLAAAAGDLPVDRPHVVLSTCNRFELYALCEDGADSERNVVSALARSAGVPARVLATATDDRAVLHLFRVAAGLESPILGEPQILGQVRSAAASSGAGPVLARLFASAVRAGRRARHETSLGERPGSLAASTVALAADRLGDLRGRRVVVLGAGAVGGLVADAFRSTRCEIVIASRTHDHARTLAARVDGVAVQLEALPAELARADVLVSCTRCPRVVVTVDDVASVRRPLLVADLALPRDVDPAVAALPGCTLYDLDELNARAGAANARTEVELAAAAAIVAQEAARFCEWRRSRTVAPVIASLRRRAEAIRAAELARMRGTLGDLSPAQRRAVETVTVQIVNKLLHEPTVRLRAAADEELVPALCRLFALAEAA